MKWRGIDTAAALVASRENRRDSRTKGDEGCLLYTSDAADERSSVDLGGRRIIKKKNKLQYHGCGTSS